MPETIDSIKGKTNVVFAFTDLIKPPEEAHQKALEIAAKEIKESNKIPAHLEKHYQLKILTKFHQAILELIQ